MVVVQVKVQKLMQSCSTTDHADKVMKFMTELLWSMVECLPILQLHQDNQLDNSLYNENAALPFTESQADPAYACARPPSSTLPPFHCPCMPKYTEMDPG